jgi:hypothetical protein
MPREGVVGGRWAKPNDFVVESSSHANFDIGIERILR